MKILIIPDVHGRAFWRKPCEKDWDKIVFLGDYVDPYPGEAEQSDVMGELIDIVELKRQNPDKVVLLWGNHDCFYWCDPYRRQLDYWSRHDNLRHDDIQAFFRENLDKFQWAYEQDGFLFTHAGVNNSMGKLLVEEYDKLDADVINDFFNKEITWTSVKNFFGFGKKKNGLLPQLYKQSNNQNLYGINHKSKLGKNKFKYY